MSRRRIIARATTAALAAAVVAGCSSGAPSGAKSQAPLPTSTTASRSPDSTPTPRPPGPATTFSGPVTGGKGISLLSAGALTSTATLRVSEYFASGTAQAYTASGAPADGRWMLRPAGRAAYRTRVIVRIPADPKRFNGTLVVEWLNVSAGADTAPDYSYAAAELERKGYAYVGVSAQQVGIDGSSSGDIASQLLPGLGVSGLRAADPARYRSLHHPGDAYLYDMFTQVARALRAPGRTDVLDGLRPQRVIAMGESQSASRLTTYVDGVQPLTREFDGFFVHSRGGGAAPLSGSGDGGSFVDGQVRIRTDTAVRCCCSKPRRTLPCCVTTGRSSQTPTGSGSGKSPGRHTPTRSSPVAPPGCSDAGPRSTMARSSTSSKRPSAP